MGAKKKNKGKNLELYTEQYALSELKTELLKELDRDTLEATCDKIHRANMHFAEHLPAERIIPMIRTRYTVGQAREQTHRRKRAYYHHGAWALAATLSSVMVVVWLVKPDQVLHHPNVDHQQPSGSGRVRIKGPAKRTTEQAYLNIYRNVDGIADRLDNGATVRAGDLIQVAYVAADSKYGVVFSIDGAGLVTLHWPESLDEVPLLEQTGETPLIHSYELDAAPQYERFVFVTSNQPIDVKQVLKAANKLAKNTKTAGTRALNLPFDWRQTSFTLKKVEP